MASMGINTAFWRDRPTLVTGATGLVGSWLVKRLCAAGAGEAAAQAAEPAEKIARFLAAADTERAHGAAETDVTTRGM